MNWKTELESIEREFDWRSAIQLSETLAVNSYEPYARTIFVLLDFVVEGRYTWEEHDYAAKKLKELFDKSFVQFSDNNEFLFLVGFVALRAEWYFGLSSDEAVVMLKTPMMGEADNTLYKWGFYAGSDQRQEINTTLKIQLSEQILFKETFRLDWLRSKGLIGEYIIGILERSYDSLMMFTRRS